VSLLKTLDFKSIESHHAKCVFGNLRRVEIHEVKGDLNSLKGPYSDQDSKDFLEIYEEIFLEKSKEVPPKDENERKSTY
jgi:hypothetical protein